MEGLKYLEIEGGRRTLGVMNILFVGKSEELPGLIESLFAQYVMPSSVAVAEDAGQGAAALDEAEFQAVFMEYPAPGGGEAVQALKKKAPLAPVILIAEPEAEAEAVSALREGAYDYVLKDASYHSTLSRLIEIICSRHLLRKVRLGNDELYTVLSEEILKSKEQWQTTLDAVRDYIFVTDRHNIIRRANVSFARRFDMHPRGLIGMRADELLGREVFMKGLDLQRCASSGETAAAEVRLNGDIFAVSVFPARFDDDEVYVYSMKDITEVKKLREEIFRSKEQWQATLDAVGDYIFVTGRDRVIRRANVSFAGRFGKHPRDLVGVRADELLGEGLFLEGHELQRGVALNEPASAEVTVGDEVFAVSVSPARFGDDEVYVYSLKDITETKRLREQLYHSDKLASIGLLVSGVAHEINNPLTGILGYTEMLSAMDLPETVRKYLEKITFAAERCKSFVGSLLRFSRRQPHRRELARINEIIDRTLEIRMYWARSHNAEIVRDFAELPATSVNEQQIQQVILNMLLNAEQAIDESGRRGRIVLSTAYDEASDRISIRVSDNGTGIPGDDMDKLFDPFFTTKPPDKGTGLGLSIARGIIEEHGGTMRVQSEVGKGTSFTIEIPVDREPQALQ